MRACRVDANQAKIVEAWRNAGASVKLVHTVKNFCDAIVAYNGVIYIAEIKDGSKSSGSKKLTPGEEGYKAEIELRGCTYNVVENVKQALKMIGFGQESHAYNFKVDPATIVTSGHEPECSCQDCQLLKKIFR